MNRLARGNNKVHDSLFKELSEIPEEMREFTLNFLGKNFSVEDLELQGKEYRIQKGLRTKNIDVLYKIKNEELFILLEHQSTIDYIMAERMNENCLAVIESRKKFSRNLKNIKAPIIYPLLLNTSARKWEVPTTIEQVEKNRYNIPKLKYPQYTVIDINDYTIEELLKIRTGLGLAMAFERIKTKEDMEILLKVINNRKMNTKEKRAMEIIMNRIEEVMPSLIKKLSEDEFEKFKSILKEILGKERYYMPNFDKFMVNLLEEKEKEMLERTKEKEKEMLERTKEKEKEMLERTKEKEKEILKKEKEILEKAKKVEEKAKKQGEKEGITKAVIEMIKDNLSDRDIIKYTHITKKELEKLKLQIA